MEKLKQSIVDKAVLKQDVFAKTKLLFEQFKVEIGIVSNEIHDFITPSDARVSVELKTTEAYEVRMTLAGDTIVFHMHTNVFTFPEYHMIHKSPYVMDTPGNAYCGIINVYNFLTDSYRFHRVNDSGYLVARIFVNREGHFFVEGQGQLGFLFKDFATKEFDKESMRSVIVTALQHIIDFDLYTPPYQTVKEVTLGDVQAQSQSLRLKTGKRLGFQFESSADEVSF
jgi:hypothetical protein